MYLFMIKEFSRNKVTAWHCNANNGSRMGCFIEYAIGTYKTSLGIFINLQVLLEANSLELRPLFSTSMLEFPCKHKNDNKINCN